MSESPEIESKILLSREDYRKVLQGLNLEESSCYPQTNYYVDTPDLFFRNHHMVLRIRKKKEFLECTLKTPQQEGVLEHNERITPGEFLLLEEKNIFPENSIRDYLMTLGIRPEELKIITSLTTERIDKVHPEGLISLDRNTYNGNTDYELEVESSTMEKARAIASEVMEKSGIANYSFSHVSKQERAYQSRRKQVKNMEHYILSGIKPTGQLQLGNYIGAIRNFVKYQEDDQKTFIFIADLHALTLPIEPDVLYNNTRDLVAFYLAAGLDPKKVTIFLQSQVPAHAELGTILGNYAYMGEMSRMTQFKEKSAKLNEKSIGLGLFTYPVLMAADILLYNAEFVPVGEDQKQHVELCRNLAIRFNNHYGKEIFTIPTPVIAATGARIMSLSDPTKKMSKSDPKGDIFLKDDPKVARKKIMSAVTDMEGLVYFDKEKKPGISNLLTIYACMKDITVEEAAKEFKGCTRYGDFKKAVADVVCSFLEDLQAKYNAVIASGIVDEVLADGAKRASEIADATVARVKKAIGLYGAK